MADRLRVILLIETSTGYGRQLIHGIARYSRLNGPWTFYCEPGSKEKPRPSFKKWPADGVIARDVPNIKDVISHRIPAIITNTSVRTRKYPHIVCDNESTGRMAAEHLLEKKFSKFAYCGYSDTLWGRERKVSFCNAIQRAGFRTYVFMQSRSETQQAWGAQFVLLENWVKSLPIPIAIMCSNDERAHQLMEAVTDLGLHVPEEVAVMGADNDTVIHELTNPALTSIMFSHEQAGFDAARLLHRLVKGEKVVNQTVVTKPVRVVARASTDSLLIADEDVAKAHHFIREHANRAIQVSDVAEAVSMSKRTLQIRFKRAMNSSVYEEIRLHQVDFVAQLLIETDLPISRIGEMSGFTTSQYMSQVFRKVKGTSLRQYRKEHHAW